MSFRKLVSSWWSRTVTGLKPRADEPLDHEWTSLKSLWLTARATNPGPEEADKTWIDAAFAAHEAPNGAMGGWPKFNEVEQRVGRNLTGAQLKIEFGQLLQNATERALLALDLHKARSELFAADPPDLPVQRQAYLALLYDLQSAFINQRFERRLRGEVARRLFNYGVIVLLLAGVAPLLLVWTKLAPMPAVDAAKVVHNDPLVLNRFSSSPLFSVGLVAGFGVVGAFFSRAIAFQASIARVTFDSVQQLYLGRVLRVRLLFGMVGAIIFYFILRAGLIGGTMFPDLSKLGIGEHMIWRMGPDGPFRVAGTQRLEPAGLTVLEPTLDMAKLLVWSFIAGFSERLVPDALARTEAQATKKDLGTA